MLDEAGGAGPKSLAEVGAEGLPWQWAQSRQMWERGVRVLSLEGLKGELPSRGTLFLCDLAPHRVPSSNAGLFQKPPPPLCLLSLSLCLYPHPHLRPGPYRCPLFPPLSSEGPEGNFSWDGGSSISKGRGVSSPTWGTLASHSPPSVLPI